MNCKIWKIVSQFSYKNLQSKFFVLILGLIFLSISVTADCINCDISDTLIDASDLHLSESVTYFRSRIQNVGGFVTPKLYIQTGGAGLIDLEYIVIFSHMPNLRLYLYDDTNTLISTKSISGTYTVSFNVTKGYFYFYYKSFDGALWRDIDIYKNFKFNLTTNNDILDFTLYEGEDNQAVKVWNRYKTNGLCNVILVGSDSSALLWNGYNSSFNQFVDVPDNIVDSSGIYQYCEYNWDTTNNNEQQLCWDVMIYDHGSTFYSGYVRSDYDNMPIENALIELYALDYTGYVTTRTDHRGYYEKYNIPFGRYLIKISHSNYDFHSHYSVFNQSIIEDVYLNSNCLNNPRFIGYVFDEKNNEPITDSIIRIYDNNTDDLSDMIKTDVNGYYHSKCLNKSVYELIVTKDEYIGQSIFINTSNVTYESINNFWLKDEIDNYTLTLKFFDKDTYQPIQNFSLILDGSIDVGDKGIYLEIKDLIEINKKGCYYNITNNSIKIHNLPFQYYRLTVGSDNYVTQIFEESYFNDYNDETKLILLKNQSLICYYNLSIHVEDTFSVNLSNVVIEIYSQIYDYRDYFNFSKTDLNGNCIFYNLSSEILYGVFINQYPYKKYDSDVFISEKNITKSIILEYLINLYSIEGRISDCKYYSYVVNKGKGISLNNIPVEIYNFTSIYQLHLDVKNDSYIEQIYSDENGVYKFTHLPIEFYSIYVNGSIDKYSTVISHKYISRDIKNHDICLDSLVIRNLVRIYIDHIEFSDLIIEPKIIVYNNYKEIINSKICEGDSCYFILEPALYFFDAKKYGFRIHSINKETSFRRPYPFSVHGDVEDLVILMSDDIIPYIPETQEEFLIFLDKWGWKFGVIVFVLFPVLVSIMIGRQIYNNVRGRKIR